jgi:putative ABC transport system ATP-binding protein
MADTLIALTGVSKDYVGGGGVVHALRDVDIVIERGEFVAVVGQSGSGKSTLMNILGCLDRPTHGAYELADIEVGARGNDARALVRNHLIGFIFQGFNLLPRTTALENVELPLQYRGVGVRERRARAKAALAAVNLADREHHTPNQLSGGQQQRVAIARALVSDPPLLLADEPTGNLDTRTSLEVLALLQRLNRERAITIVLVTHEQDIAACANRVMTFRDGRMVSDVRQEKPLDAAAELAALAPSEVFASDEAAADPAIAAAHAARAPVPFVTYLAMFGGALLGVLVGSLYSAIIVGERVAWIGPLFAVICEAWLGSRVARARLGRPLSSDQRLRVALWYTGVIGAVQAVAGWFILAKSQSPVLAHFTGVRGAATFAIVLVLAFAALALLRYLLLSVFASMRGPRKEARA